MVTLDSNYAFQPIHQLAAQIQSKQLSPVALLELYLKRIAHYDKQLQAFVEVYADQALQAAKGAGLSIRAGHSLGPLHGIPIAIKDLVEIEGRITTGGCSAWRDRRSAYTATIVKKLLAAGMIIIGKSHTVEFAYGGWGTNQHMGTPWNPWDLATHRIPGGSSSGSAVATAAGLAAAGIGTDTGGSVRLPAAFCGLVGLKTTVGRISTHGVLPLSHTLDTVGPLVRSVEDAALLFNALQGPDECHPATFAKAPANPLPILKNGIRNMRFAILDDSEKQLVEPEVLLNYEASLAVMEQLGAALVEVKLPRSLGDFRDATANIIGAEAYSYLSETVDSADIILDEDVRQRILAGKSLAASAYIKSLRERQQARCELAIAMDGIDALLTPTVAMAAPPVAEINQSTTPAYFTRFGNLLELCGLAVPNGYTNAGLPTSLLINGRSYDETGILRIGWAYEQATKKQQRLPTGLLD